MLYMYLPFFLYTSSLVLGIFARQTINLLKIREAPHHAPIGGSITQQLYSKLRKWLCFFVFFFNFCSIHIGGVGIARERFIFLT